MSTEQTYDVDEIRRQVIKLECERDHLFFTRYFFKKRQAIKFKVNWHHALICDAIQKVIDGTYQNLVINVSPGSSKTELAVINLIARGLALNPYSRFLHISSGAELAMLNSQTARDIITSTEFQELWPMQIANDAKSKHRWNVMVDGKKAGGVYAVSLSGQIIGFRAGHMVEGFSGAIILDDPLKADDIHSEAAVKNANRKLISTIKSRRAHPRVPIVVIMQRLGQKDPTGFIRSSKILPNCHFIEIPALVTDEYIENLPDNIRALCEDEREVDDKGRFSYWPYKEPLADLLDMEAGRGQDAEGNRISSYVFWAQYMQQPKAIGGNIIKGGWFPRISILPQIQYRMIYADTAQKTKERNDYSVFQCWGITSDKIILLDQARGKWEAPDLKQKAIDFWNKHNAVQGLGTLRKMKVEDKSSGTGLIQDIKRTGHIPIEGIERTKDKLTRVMDATPHIERGAVVLLDNLPFLSDFIDECEAFTADDTHAHDDQIDPMCDAIKDKFVKPKGFFN